MVRKRVKVGKKRVESQPQTGMEITFKATDRRDTNESETSSSND